MSRSPIHPSSVRLSGLSSGAARPSLPILTAAQMKTCDAFTISACGIPSRTLMERAARAVTEVLCDRALVFGTGKLLVLCGSGNNGGDGFAVARMARSHRTSVAVLYTGPFTDGAPDTACMSVECAVQYREATACRIPILPPSAIEEALHDTVSVVDAVFGIGLDRPVTGETAEVLLRVAALDLPVLAIDIPSGIHADTGAIMGCALPADVTVAIEALKAGHLLYPGADYSGELTVRDIGIDLTPCGAPYATLADRALAEWVLPPRRRRTNKGTYGRVVALCGTVGMSGAAVLAAKGALCAGAGLCEVVTPVDNYNILGTALPEALITTYTPAAQGTTAIEAVCDTVRASVGRADALLLGCGLGRTETAYAALRTALTACPADGHIPCVLDADALNLLAEDPTLWTTIEGMQATATVITPHPGEMARLCGVGVADILSDLPGFATRFAAAHGVVVVLKDAHTVIASPDGALFVCAAGNAGLAKGGSGDLLAGAIAALLSQNRARLQDPTDPLTPGAVAAAGVYLHAAAADALAETHGEYGLLASDIAGYMPLILHRHTSTATRLYDDTSF